MKHGWWEPKWARGLIAFVAATTTALFVTKVVSDASFKEAVRIAPHDGLDGLTALFDGLTAGFFCWIAVLVLTLYLLSALVSRRKNQRAIPE